MSRITERLYIGSQINTQQDLFDIKAAGVSHIVDCCEQDDNPLLRAKGHPVFAIFVPGHPSHVEPGFVSRDGYWNYLWEPTSDDGVHPKPVTWFAGGIDFALGALAHPGFKVLVHCAAGHARAPSMVYAIMRAIGWTKSEALDWIHARRPASVGGIDYADDAELALHKLGWI